MRFENTRRFLEASGVKKEDAGMIIKDLNDALEETQEDLYKVIKSISETNKKQKILIEELTEKLREQATNKRGDQP